MAGSAVSETSGLTVSSAVALSGIDDGVVNSTASISPTGK